MYSALCLRTTWHGMTLCKVYSTHITGIINTVPELVRLAVVCTFPFCRYSHGIIHIFVVIRINDGQWSNLEGYGLIHYVNLRPDDMNKAKVPSTRCDFCISVNATKIIHKRYFLPIMSEEPYYLKISNYVHYNVWVEITYPFPNFNCATFGVWRWISNFIPHFTGNVINHTCWD